MRMKSLGALLALAWLVPRPSEAQAYSGAEFRTAATYLYGKFEVRMQSAPGVGLLSSFFTYSDLSYPTWNEVDVEILGRYNNQVQVNHITGQASGPVHHSYAYPMPFNPHQSFNTYGFEWYPDSLLYFVNGKMIYRAISAVNQLSFRQKIMMNIWISTNQTWVGAFSPAVLPVYAYYDYVSYAAYTPGRGPGGSNFTPTWKEDFNQANPPGWDKAAHGFEGNMAYLTPLNAIVQGGMAIVCLTEKGKEGYKGVLPDPSTEIFMHRPARRQDGGFASPDLRWFRLDGKQAFESLKPEQAPHILLYGR